LRQGHTIPDHRSAIIKIYVFTGASYQMTWFFICCLRQVDVSPSSVV